MSKQKHETIYTCALCEESDAFESARAFIDHLAAVHPEVMPEDDSQSIPATRHGLSFLDGSDFYQNTYRWTLLDGRDLCDQCISGPRDRDDPMRGM